MKPSIAVIGGVTSTQIVIEKLVEHDLKPAKVYGYKPNQNENVSGYVDLETISNNLGIAFTGFRRVSQAEPDVISKNYDIIFVVGLSQLVSRQIIDSANLGCIGYHPTRLPKGRGRAPLAWLILNGGEGAATFFQIEEGVDSGPIYAQSPIMINEYDDANDVINKLYGAMRTALDDLCQSIKSNQLQPVSQNESMATYFGARKPEDGVIEWDHDAYQIDRLIKATAPPHPGAYSYHRDRIIKVLGSRVNTDDQIIGVVGRVVKVTHSAVTVQCGHGLLDLTHLTNAEGIRVGDKLGYEPQFEIYRLRQEIEHIKKKSFKE